MKIIVLVITVAFLFSTPVLAEESHEGSADLVKVGNELCPVSGENVKSMGGGSVYEYNGKIYNLCCPGCVNMFEKDPEKYSTIAEENAAQESEKKDHKEHHHHAH